MPTRRDPIEVGERGDESDRSMPAHPEIRGAVEKDHSRYARVVNGFTQQSTNNRIRTARLVHYRAAKVVVFISEALEAVRQRVLTELWSTCNNYTCGLTTRM
jgi:hypothetical protein